jgi:hypothetical protein
VVAELLRVKAATASLPMILYRMEVVRVATMISMGALAGMVAVVVVVHSAPFQAVSFRADHQ